jgi:hypothetical protein
MENESQPNSNTQEPGPSITVKPQLKLERSEYYLKNKSGKITDFLIGFFGVIGANILLAIFVPLLSMAGGANNTVASALALGGGIMGILELIAYVILIVVFFKRQRRFIAIGMLSTLLLPLLLLGACLIMVFGLSAGQL